MYSFIFFFSFLCKRTGTRGVADVGGLAAYLCAKKLVHVVWLM